LNRAGLLVCISSPSGGGKTTICKELLNHHKEYTFSISCTTRPPRESEQDGKDYYFLSRPEFEQKIAAGELAEYEKVHGHYYGTLRSEVKRALEQGEVLLVDIDVKGAMSLKQLYGRQCFTIFLAPPDVQALKERLRNRGTESEKSMARRLKRLDMEMSYGKQFDCTVVNEELDTTVSAVEKIIEQKRQALTEEMIHGAGDNSFLRT